MSSKLRKLLEKMTVQNLTEEEYSELALEFSKVHSKEAGDISDDDEQYIDETIADELRPQSGQPIGWVVDEKKNQN
jgi:hypothetical protein